MTGQDARVAAHIGVLNEKTMIGPCIAHLRRLGVSDFVVFDLNSTDGTRDVLAGMEGPDLRVVDFPRGGTDAQLMKMAVRAVNDSPADWVLLLDADEFPLALGGRLGPVLGRVPAGTDVLEIARHNIVLGPEGPRMALPPAPLPAPGEVDLFARMPPGFRDRLAEDATLSWLGFVPAPKIAVRPGRIGRFLRGLHGAHPRPGESLETRRCRDIVIAHAALTDFPRFQAKVASIRATFAAYGGEMGANFGWHWRRWVALDDAGALGAEYERSFLPAARLEQLRREGIVQSAAALLAAAGQEKEEAEAP